MIKSSCIVNSVLVNGHVGMSRQQGDLGHLGKARRLCRIYDRRKKHTEIVVLWQERRCKLKANFFVKPISSRRRKCIMFCNLSRCTFVICYINLQKNELESPPATLGRLILEDVSSLLSSSSVLESNFQHRVSFFFPFFYCFSIFSYFLLRHCNTEHKWQVKIKISVERKWRKDEKKLTLDGWTRYVMILEGVTYERHPYEGSNLRGAMD